MTTEINTFSAAVDDVVARSGRPDRVADIIAFVRVTIRELQALRFFRNDLIEDTLTADAANYVWDYPQEFRLLRTVKYPYFDGQGKPMYPPEILPGKLQKDFDYYYYGGPGYYVFAGTALADLIDVAYYKFAKKIPYYAVANRPATFVLDDDAWSYLASGTDAENLIAREKVSNWVLFNYYDTVVEGGMAKILKTVGDPRSMSSFALYKSYQQTMTATEPSDSLNK
ncbi:MAG: hypothetical protein KAS32_11635 [Candidatus Peribacteraceae bacterium]|nr:hypothetical protein [Candidatus Peribacteraceae bacterium]